jgi:hypothetical protein
MYRFLEVAASVVHIRRSIRVALGKDTAGVVLDLAE